MTLTNLRLDGLLPVRRVLQPPPLVPRLRDIPQLYQRLLESPADVDDVLRRGDPPQRVPLAAELAGPLPRGIRKEPPDEPFRRLIPLQLGLQLCFCVRN